MKLFNNIVCTLICLTGCISCKLLINAAKDHQSAEITILSYNVRNYKGQEAIFKAYRTWEDARSAGIFTTAFKDRFMPRKILKQTA